MMGLIVRASAVLVGVVLLAHVATIGGNDSGAGGFMLVGLGLVMAGVFAGRGAGVR